MLLDMQSEGLFGAKGIGETGIVAVAPTIANAVASARVRASVRYPTPKRVFSALTQRPTLGRSWPIAGSR
jgi:CO/xanthine dehydrogenase Mo-binding subunit